MKKIIIYIAAALAMPMQMSAQQDSVKQLKDQTLNEVQKQLMLPPLPVQNSPRLHVAILARASQPILRLTLATAMQPQEPSKSNCSDSLALTCRCSQRTFPTSAVWQTPTLLATFPARGCRAFRCRKARHR